MPRPFIAALILVSMVVAGCTTRVPVEVHASTLKAKSSELARGDAATVEAVDGKAFTVRPQTRSELVVYGPEDEGGGRPATKVERSFQDIAKECLQKTPCVLDQIPNNTVLVGTRKVENGLTALVLSVSGAAAFGGVCISGLCGEALETASPGILIGAGVLTAFVLLLQFAR